ncbi:DUF2147 domain-containing protein [uncultured Umboniibacter sp.]|uniref:DUF2147 domain-containing protein n=1 Tax=uncultured Umboniibacter sp. TaxID=1798917 RepID=UPI0026386825|nr:DUF2147 domain-containing protein [uncultured Umboniibacter sp.]
MKIFARLIAISWLLVATMSYAEESPIGYWNTVDDSSGEIKSTVELYMEGDLLYGRIVELTNPEVPDPICEKCTGEKQNQPVIGLTIIEGLSFDGDHWADGVILDPENGETYDCVIWREGKKLMVRGYVGFFYRTQSWVLSEETRD